LDAKWWYKLPFKTPQAEATSAMEVAPKPRCLKTGMACLIISVRLKAINFDLLYKAKSNYFTKQTFGCFIL
jgi:hypothetical protein